MSVVTTLFAPITERSPIVTPLVTTTFAPHHTLSPIRVGPFVVKPCHVTGRAGSSKRWLPSVTKQPLANMQWSPISTSATAATITFRFRNVPEPMRTRASPGAVIHTPGSNSVCSPTSRRPSRKASSTLPCTGQRQNARRRANSRWIAMRFHGNVLRSYQRHFCHQSFASLTRARALQFVQSERQRAKSVGLVMLRPMQCSERHATTHSLHLRGPGHARVRHPGDRGRQEPPQQAPPPRTRGRPQPQRHPRSLGEEVPRPLGDG